MERDFLEVMRDIKPGETWECTDNQCDIKSISVLKLGCLVIDKHNTSDRLAIPAHIKFKLLRDRYSFTEAFESYEQGKEIESVEFGFKHSKTNSKELSFQPYEIRGEWYINE